uniref:RelA/SpoT domain-containing protein n=1 Tax=Candidatus Thiodubiliella endoseptemdiera TaxID=2738886 RepID=UPI0034DDEFB2
MVISNKKIDQAGKRLAGKDSQISSEEADLILQQFRIIHQRPMNLCRQMIEGILKQQGINALLAERVKRNPSIVKKLQIQTNMKLSQMQDIVGLRVILGNMNEVNLIKDEIKKEYKNSKFKFVKEDNYIESPRHSGYRSIHMIYKYDEQIKSQKQCKVEIQIRTEIQHSWATAVEVLGTYLNQSLKQSHGDNRYLDVFKDISKLLASLECEDDKVDSYFAIDIQEKVDDMKLMDIFQKINTAFQEEEVDKNSAEQYLLLKMNAADKKTEICHRYGKNQFERANQEYSAMELATQNEEVEVVLLSIQDIRELQKLYPNYFMDTMDFIKNLHKQFYPLIMQDTLKAISGWNWIAKKDAHQLCYKVYMRNRDRGVFLSESELQELTELYPKVIDIDNSISGSEIERLLGLIVKNGDEVEMLTYMKTLGFDSIDKVKNGLEKHRKDLSIIAGILITSGIISIFG